MPGGDDPDEGGHGADVVPAQHRDRGAAGVEAGVVGQHGRAHAGGPPQQVGAGEPVDAVGDQDGVGARQGDVDDARDQLSLRVFLGEPREPLVHGVHPCRSPHG